MELEEEVLTEQQEAEIEDPTIVKDPDNGVYQKLVDHCLALYETFSTSKYRETKLAEIEDSRKAYEQVEEDTTFPWQDASNITLPLTMITVDNLEPRLVAGLVGKDPVVNFDIEGMMKKDDSTLVIEDWYNKELKQTTRIDNVAMDVVHTLLLEGTYYAVPEYEKKTIKRRDFSFSPQTGQMMMNPDKTPAVVDSEVAIFDGGKVKQIPFNDILCADDIGTLEQWNEEDKIRIIRPTYGELMQNRTALGYMNIGPWLVTHKTGQEIAEEDQSPSQNVAGVEITGQETIRCIECHVKYCIHKDEEADEKDQRDFRSEYLVAQIALDSRMLIRLVKRIDLNWNNESIIKRIRLFPEAGRSFGTSVYGKIKSIQNGASDFFNAMLNIAYIAMIPFYFYEEAAGLRGKQEIKPGAGIAVDSVKGILFPNFNVQPAAYLAFIELFIQLWERAGSIANPQMGRPSDTQKTATEIMSVVTEGNIKFNYQAATLKDEFIDLLKTLYDLYYMRMPLNKQFIYGGKPVVIQRQLMRRNFKFSLSGSTEQANKLIERKEAEDLLALTQNNPLVNPVEPLKDVLKAYGRSDTNKYINPQITQLIQVYLQNPDIIQAIQAYLATKAKTAAEIQGGRQNVGPAVQ